MFSKKLLYLPDEFRLLIGAQKTKNMAKETPNEVTSLAEMYGGIAIFVGETEGKEVYLVDESDGDEIPMPVGLPVSIVWDGRNASDVIGTESLALLARFD